MHRGDVVRALLGYVVLLLGLVAMLVLLSLLVDEWTGLGRIIWLGVGLLLGSLWAVRSRVPLLGRAPVPVAVGGWLGLILAAILTLVVAPMVLPSALTDATRRSGGQAARPAPSPAAIRTGTLGPTRQPTPVRSTASPTAPSAPVLPASPAAVADSASVDLTPSPLPDGSPVPTPGPLPDGSPMPTPGRSPIAARATATRATSRPAGFSPDRYLGQGNAYSCVDFGSQAEAQAVLRADPSDPNLLDLRRDGLACETNPPPRDTRRVPRPAP